jgi:7,8-dihydroneopterin aldolase/epimerase/oxygenase
LILVDSMSILKGRSLQETVAGLNTIRIRNAVFYAYHGVMEDEQNLGGNFEIDVDMYGDFLPAAESDSLKKTVDYEKVYAFVGNTVLEKKHFLLESLAHVIARGLLREFFNLEVVTVRIRKPHPPVRGVVDYVEVEISEQR